MTKKNFASLIEKWRSQMSWKCWKSLKMSHLNFHDKTWRYNNCHKKKWIFANKHLCSLRSQKNETFWMIFKLCQSRKFSSKNWVYASKSKGLWRMLWRQFLLNIWLLPGMNQSERFSFQKILASTTTAHGHSTFSKETVSLGEFSP